MQREVRSFCVFCPKFGEFFVIKIMTQAIVAIILVRNFSIKVFLKNKSSIIDYLNPL